MSSRHRELPRREGVLLEVAAYHEALLELLPGHEAEILPIHLLEVLEGDLRRNRPSMQWTCSRREGWTVARGPQAGNPH
jgi:hypothetical protein